MSWKAEVTTAVTDNDWTSNGLRFATREEAEDYVADLAFRWTAVRSTRTVDTADPVSHSFIGRTLQPVKLGQKA